MSEPNSGAPMTRRGPLTRIVVACAAALTAWHILASFLWIAPVTPLRDALPKGMLTSYMIPWYGQSWSVFAPEPINGDYKLMVRAIVAQPGGQEMLTDWVDATAVERSMATHNLFPPRAASLAIHQASALKDTWEKLTDKQKEIVALNYFKDDNWLGRMQIAMNGTDSTTNVTSYIVQERFTDAYATQVAHAVWGKDVVRIQYEASRQNIIPFEQRNNPDAKRPPVQLAPTGWRGLIVMPDQSEKDFADTFRPAYAGLAK